MQSLLGNCKEGHLFIVSAPAGTGKTTLVQMLCDEFPSVVRSLSFTTRLPRPGEIEGKDYHFISKEEFEKKIQEGDFIEWAEVFGNYYGTSKGYIQSRQKAAKHVVLVIDTQGAMQLKKKVAATFIFISPPSVAALRERLFKRKTESELHIEERISWAEKEMAQAPHYDYHIVNDNVLVAYEILRSIIIAQEHKTRSS